MSDRPVLGLYSLLFCIASIIYPVRAGRQRKSCTRASMSIGQQEVGNLGRPARPAARKNREVLGHATMSQEGDEAHETEEGNIRGDKVEIISLCVFYCFHVPSKVTSVTMLGAPATQPCPSTAQHSKARIAISSHCFSSALGASSSWSLLHQPPLNVMLEVLEGKQSGLLWRCAGANQPVERMGRPSQDLPRNPPHATKQGPQLSFSSTIMEATIQHVASSEATHTQLTHPHTPHC